jgi:hypothetical protein
MGSIRHSRSALAMNFQTIVCLDDLTRAAGGAARDFLHDLVRVPVWHVAGIDIARSPRCGQRHNLAAGFRSEDFAALCGQPRSHWSALHQQLPQPAEDYLAALLPPDSLVIGAELPPWLRGLLDRRELPWLDLRLAPMRFGVDLHLALATSDPRLHAAARPWAISAAEVLTEACLRSAQVRLQCRQTAAAEPVDDLLVWVGQAEDDPALLDDSGRFVRAADFSAVLRDVAANRRLVHTSEAPDSAFAAAERAQLASIVGRPVPVCQIDLATLLAGDDLVAFVGLSAAALQEAQWFGKDSVALHSAACELDFDGPHDSRRWTLVHAADMMSEPLWTALLDRPARPGAVVLPRMADHLRSLLAAPAAVAAPGQTAPDMSIDGQRLDGLRLEIEGLKEALRVVLRQTALRAAMADRPEAAHA